MVRYIFLALSLAACAAPVDAPGPWHGDTTFTTSERVMVERGATAAVTWDAPHVSQNERTIYRREVLAYPYYCPELGSIYLDPSKDLETTTRHLMGYTQ